MVRCVDCGRVLLFSRLQKMKGMQPIDHTIVKVYSLLHFFFRLLDSVEFNFVFLSFLPFAGRCVPSLNDVKWDCHASGSESVPTYLANIWPVLSCYYYFINVINPNRGKHNYH